MTTAAAAVRGVVSSVRERLERRIRPWMPPVARREFWAVQALVVVIAGGHAVLETILPNVEAPALYLLPSSLYFVPVVYAALNFGLRGSVATAVWSAILTLPNTILWHAGLERVGEVWQMAIVLAVAVFVGQRVDHETSARREAEQRERERQRSESRYRGLFDNAAEAILLLRPDGTVAEANSAAATLIDRPREALVEVPLAAILGSKLAERLRLGTAGEAVALPSNSGRPRWVESVVVQPPGIEDGRAELQLMLRDVTLQHDRQRDLETYARRTLAAREEEQRRIGRELHDGPLQSLVLLWRKLDAPEPRARDGPTVSDPAAEARDLAEATADELRRISRALRPSVLDDLGLPAALKSEATALARRTDMSVRFVESGKPPTLSPEKELTLLRVAQEALHNVERHADATKVIVRFGAARTGVRLVIRDNGRGLAAIPSASDLLDAGKLGLVGIQERARLVGGEVRIRTSPGGGTAVDVIVPPGDASRAAD